MAGARKFRLVPAGGHSASYELLVNGRTSRGLDKGDCMESARFGRVSLSLRDDLIVRRFQVPVPIPIGGRLPNSKVHFYTSFLC
jgi:hypothetical protein